MRDNPSAIRSAERLNNDAGRSTAPTEFDEASARSIRATPERVTFDPTSNASNFAEQFHERLDSYGATEEFAGSISLHPRGMLAIQSLRLPPPFRGLGSVLP